MHSECTLTGGLVYLAGDIKRADITLGDAGDPAATAANAQVIDISGCVVFPGFADVHVHFREPGFLYKETIQTGCMAASRGGYTDVCTMPNVNPVPDSLAHLDAQRKAIRESARVRVHPFGAITVGEAGEAIADMEALAPYVIGFSDDGRGIKDAGLMREAMARAKAANRVIAAHCEDMCYVNGGCIRAGAYAAAHGLPGILPESEYMQLERDLQLARDTGCAYHMCHMSTRESARLIRAAKADGVNVTCETAPHYLLLDEGALEDDGRFKMNPPLGSRQDREALVEAVFDGTVDMLATDHAPHSAREKGNGLRGSLMGVVGLETAFPVLYTHLVKENGLPLDKLIRLLSENPRRRFGIDASRGDACVFDINRAYTVDPNDFLSMGKSTPFAGRKVWGACRLTAVSGQIVYRETKF